MESDPNVSREGTKMDAAEVRQNFAALKEETDAISASRQGLPREKVRQGPQGKISAADLSFAIGGTSANSNSVQTSTLHLPTATWKHCAKS